LILSLKTPFSKPLLLLLLLPCVYREEGRGKGEVKEGVEVCVRKQRVSLIDFRERDKPTLCFVLSLCVF
jgi:hypothetical protein